MKRLIIFLALLSIGLAANAQRYYPPDMSQLTPLDLGVREPTFYYWDTNWWDYYALGQYDTLYYFPRSLANTGIGQPEYARYIWTDSSLRVIGIAAAISVEIWYDYWQTHDGDTLPFLDEYFNLYEIDPSNDSMILLASQCWNKFEPRYKLSIKSDPQDSWAKDYEPVYEVYFDSAITVSDSFYVAMTQNNNYDKGYGYLHSVNYRVGLPTIHTVEDSPVTPSPNYYRRRFHEPLTSPGQDRLFRISDTNWHVIGRYFWYYRSGLHEWTYVGDSTIFNGFMAIFPILDTSSDNSYCASPSQFEVIYVSDEVAVFSWNGGTNSSLWELSIFKEVDTVTTDTVIQCTTNHANVHGLDTASWYTASIRTVCGTNKYGQWSDSIRFYVPAKDPEPVEIDFPESLADQFTYLMPNPATSAVTVASSFRISSVDVFSLTGQLMASAKANAMSVPLDLSSFPAGTYIVRVSTNHGMATKKLVIK